MVISIRLTSACSTSRLPWIRSRAWATASCVARSASATPWRPTLIRAWFIIENMARIPPFSGPTSQPTHASSSPKLIVQVGEPWMPILCSIDTHRTSLRDPSGSTFGTRKRLMPFVPGGASGSLPRTRWTMFSAISCSPKVM